VTKIIRTGVQLPSPPLFISVLVGFQKTRRQNIADSFFKLGNYRFFPKEPFGIPLTGDFGAERAFSA
jgi:hypothetical protein